MDDLNSMKRRMSGTSATSTLYERRRSLLTQPSPVQDTGFSASRSPAVRPAPFTPILHPLRNDTDTAHSALLSPATNGGDPLLDVTPDDEHRPFLLHTTLADLLPTRISLSLPRRISPRLLLVIFCSAAFLLLLALLSTAPLSLTSLSLLSPTARFQSKLHHAAQSYRDLHLRKRLDLIARDKIVRAEERVTPQDGGKGGKRFEQVVKRNAFPYLTLTDKEVEEVKKARAGVLWGPSDMKLGELVMDRKASYPHEFTTIFLHGLAQHVPEDAFIPNALWYKYPSTRWVSLQAPDRELSLLAIGIDATVYVPGWFNMKTRPYDALNDRDDEAFFSSTRALNAVIAKERSLLIQRRRLAAGTGGTEQLSAKDYASYGTEEEKKWASRRVILLGFSQGGAISLLAGLTNQYRLGGIAVFSTFLPMRRYMSRLMYDLNRTSTPIYWAHGTADPYLSYADALTCISLLSPSALPPLDSSSVGPSNFALTHPAYQLGMKDVQFSPQEGLIHLPSVQEIEEVDEWLKRVMAMASSQA